MVREQKDPKWILAGKKAAATRKRNLESKAKTKTEKASIEDDEWKRNAELRAKQKESKIKVAEPVEVEEHKTEEDDKWYQSAATTIEASVNFSERMKLQETMELPWVEKYRPETLNECVGSVFNLLKAFVKTGSLPQAFVFFGDYGLGKSTAVKCFIRDYYVTRGLFQKNATFQDVIATSKTTREYQGIFPPALYIDVTSLKGGFLGNVAIQDVVTRVQNYMKYSIGKHIRFVAIEEADRLGFDVQDGISSAIEKHKNTRTIWITNYPNQIRDRILDRAAGGQIEFKKPTASEIIAHLTRISHLEHARLSATKIKEIAEKAPSVRHAIGILQKECILVKAMRMK